MYAIPSPIGNVIAIYGLYQFMIVVVMFVHRMTAQQYYMVIFSKIPGHCLANKTSATGNYDLFVFHIDPVIS
jgi:hypothetical protein